MTFNYKEKLKEIKIFIFDVDGVFTDNIVYLTDDGNQMRTANVRDGYAVRSEEHTSELKSHHDRVCRLLLEKKKEHT